MTWQKLRLPFLALMSGGLLLVVAKFLTDPAIGKRTPYQFPRAVSLPGWQPATSSQPKAKSWQHRSYRYRQDGRTLLIEMRYLTDTNGDYKAILNHYTPITPPTNQAGLSHYQKSIGYYGLFQDQGRAYLSACINPLGESTLTREQFLRNLNTYGLQPQRLGAWVLAQADLRDRRCLWTQLSLPMNAASPESTYQELETAWVDWYRWWQPRFPTL